MNLNTLLTMPVTFDLHVAHQVGKHTFTALVVCDTPQDSLKAFDAFSAAKLEVELVRADFTLDTSRPTTPEGHGNGCYLLDEESEKLLADLFNEVGIHAHHFMNERLGSYDRFMNRVTPSDLGTVFPDGAMRLSWTAESSKYSFDFVYSYLREVYGFLIQLQELKLFQMSEEEDEDNDFESLKNRRTSALFAAGFWPDADENEQLDDRDTATLNALLVDFANPESSAYREILKATA